MSCLTCKHFDHAGNTCDRYGRINPFTHDTACFEEYRGKVTPQIQTLIDNPPLFMTNAMRCACCHLVKGCSRCCRTCRECSSRTCEIEMAKITGDDSTEWWRNVTKNMLPSCWDSVPDNIIKQLNNQARKRT